jgi:hypothetical protein
MSYPKAPDSSMGHGHEDGEGVRGLGTGGIVRTREASGAAPYWSGQCVGEADKW